MEQRLSKVMGPGFYGCHRAVCGGEITELIAKGGRGSGKSSFLAAELLWQLLRHPSCHAVVVRKVANTLRTSVYAQILWAIGLLGLEAYFRTSLSPLEMEYLPTHQRIWFFGADDPGKLKSIKPPFGHMGICWFEEMDQFDGPEELRSIEQSLFRGGDYSLSLKSFNPPAEPAHWANRLALEPKVGRLVHHSDYRSLPPQWLGRRFLLDAEHLKQIDPRRYDHEYLGLAVGLGESVFPNLRLEPIADSLIARFDRVVSGVDWGWWPDPWAFNRVYYDAPRQTLYIFDELTRHRTGNRETAALVAARTAPGEMICADSAEEKSVADYCALGLCCRGAEKGPGSVNYSMKWLQSLKAIVIDPIRCPDTAREFGEYAYEKGRDGTVLPGFPDKNNHHIDAVRYALSPIWRRRGS